MLERHAPTEPIFTTYLNLSLTECLLFLLAKPGNFMLNL